MGFLTHGLCYFDLNIICNVFLVVKVNCSSSVFNFNQTHLNIEEDQNSEQIIIKASESAQQKICLHFVSDDVILRKQVKQLKLFVCWLYSCICHG